MRKILEGAFDMYEIANLENELKSLSKMYGKEGDELEEENKTLKDVHSLQSKAL